jgi:phage FluMu protein Com
MKLTKNPTYSSLTPRPLTPGCHDGSHMIDIQCSACGNIDHLHETMLADVPTNAIIGCRCQRCHATNPVEAKTLRDGFAWMRKQGWIA